MSQLRTVLLLALMLLVTLTAVGCNGSGVQAQGVAYLDPPSDQIDGPTTDADLILERVEVEGRHAEFTGEISYDGTTLQFNINGIFHQSGLGKPDDKVMYGEDSTGNFRVLHVGLRENPPGELLATASNDVTIETPVLSVYLMPENKRQMMFVDIPITEQSLIDALLPIMEMDLERGEFHLDHWPALLGHFLREQTPDR